MIRLFVALEIPEQVRRRLVLLQGGVPGARWAAFEQLHLTIRFIGEVTEMQAADIDDALAVLRAPSFSLEIAGVGKFGGMTPRALLAGVRPNEALVHLQRKVEAAMQRLGLAAEERKFTPHVTLARLKQAPRGKVVDFLSHNALFAAAPIAVEHFALFSSHLSSSGAIYRVESVYPLQ